MQNTQLPCASGFPVLYSRQKQRRTEATGAKITKCLLSSAASLSRPLRRWAGHSYTNCHFNISKWAAPPAPLAFHRLRRTTGSTLKMEKTCSSETFDFQRTTRRYIPKDRAPHITVISPKTQLKRVLIGRFTPSDTTNHINSVLKLCMPSSVSWTGPCVNDDKKRDIYVLLNQINVLWLSCLDAGFSARRLGSILRDCSIGAGFSPDFFSFFPLAIIPPLLYTHLSPPPENPKQTAHYHILGLWMAASSVNRHLRKYKQKSLV
jgi:hypothetical protein